MTIPVIHLLRPIQKTLRALGKRGLHSLLLELDEETIERLEMRAALVSLPIEQVAEGLLREAVIQADQREKINLWQTLTPREQEVAACACQGLSYQEISKALNIESGTVHTHLKRIYRKMEVGGKQHLRVLLQDWDFSAFDHSSS